MTRPAPIFAGTLAAFVLLFGAYMGAYYVAISPFASHLSTDAPYSGAPYKKIWVEPDYRVPGVEQCFWPAYQIDRLLRPGRWDVR